MTVEKMVSILFRSELCMEYYPIFIECFKGTRGNIMLTSLMMINYGMMLGKHEERTRCRGGVKHDTLTIGGLEL